MNSSNFSNHSNLKGTHAIFTASQPYWLNYDDEKIISTFKNKQAVVKGTLLHSWAEETINLGILQPKSKKTLYSYVNDAIKYHMKTEVVLYYSDYFYGTADALCFDGQLLRIHDLKTGTTPAHMKQLEVYAAYFCLENRIKPGEIDMELRIYQNDEILYFKPTAEDILPIMDRITYINKMLIKLNEEA